MGGLLSRSSIQGNVKMGKEKRKRRHQQSAISFEPDVYLIYDENENDDPNVDFITTYELWDKNIDEEQMIDRNDPPGAPSTYSSNYSVTQNDIRSQSWSFPHDSKNSFYPTNSLRMTPPYNIPYIPNQHNQAQVHDTTNKRSKTVMPDGRPSKKVQFSSKHQQQQKQTSTFKPLINTQSWHESSDKSAPSTTEPGSLSNRSSLPRPTPGMPKMSSIQTSVGKPIYVGIDYKATLAERGQTVANQHHRKNGDRYHSDGLSSSTNNRRSHSHINHQHKHQPSIDLSRYDMDILPSKSFDSMQSKSSASQRPRAKSLTTDKLEQNIEQIPLMNNEMKSSQSKGNRRQQSSANNEIKSSKNRENHRRHHHQQQQQQLPPLSNGSPLNSHSSSQRIETKYQSTPVMRIPLSQFNQQHQKEPIIRPVAPTTTNVTRTRI